MSLKRSTLSVPGHKEKMHPKAALSRADVIMLDLEDSVPAEEKALARKQVIDSLLSIDWQEKGLSFRINGLNTPFGYRDLLEVAEAAGDRIETVVVPKIDGPADIHFVSRLLDGIELHAGRSRPIGIEASIETARGLERIGEIAKASDRLRTLVFGIVDYQVSIGARLVSISGHGEREEEIYPGHRWNFVMSRIAMAAKSRDLMAIDAPYGNFKDPDGLRQSAAISCALGYDGKWAIHPDQLDIINAVFSPSEAEIERAGRVLEAHREAERTGSGAVAVDGRMVDRATVRLALRTWEQAKGLERRRTDDG
jgi:malyl-CoA/(S)-citramalyl-CoA lyase